MAKRKHPRKGPIPYKHEQYERNRYIVALAYNNRNSLAWIARKYGISRQRVAVIIRNSWNGPLPRKQGRRKNIVNS